MKKTPNIFDFATSELSQDAFITWLLSWSKEIYKEADKALYKCSNDFVKSLLNVSSEFKIETIEAGRQWKNIDVWALVNNKYFIVIEDKKSTKEHSNQLNRYSKIAKDYYKKSDIEVKLIYFKMEEQSSYINVKEAGFSIFGRDKMIQIIKNNISEINNNILIDFYDNLVKLDREINSYLTLPLEKWHWYSWQGFYSKLQKTIQQGEWNYVSNPSGGFLGFWWDWKYSTIEKTDFQYYLQLEQEKMIFKLCVSDSNKRYEIREFYRKKLFSKANKLNIDISKFGRIGNWMGVAILNQEYRIVNENGLLNFDKTVNKLKECMTLISNIENN